VKVGVEDLTGFVVFPMYHENRLVYYVARRFNQGKPKTWNPPNITAPLHGFRTVYNQRVVLVEGCFDRMAVERAGFRSFAILGSDMSDYQLKQLDKTADFVSSIVVMLDGEAEKESRKLAKKLYQRYTDTIIELALIPNREKDPGDMTNEEIQSCIKNACLYPFMKLTTYVKQRLKNA
jgi:DNA primase